MDTTASTPWWQREPGQPGLRVDAEVLRRVPPPPAANGVPLFVGWGSAKHDSRRGFVDLDRWEGFHEAIKAEPRGLLAEAVRGFFLNGGRRCKLLLLPRAAPLEAPFRDLHGALADVIDADLVCVPEAAGAPDVNDAVLEHCEAMADRFAILDSPRVARESPPPHRSRFGALYRPWIGVDRDGRIEFVPPCGHVAGLYARIDASPGARRAPANDVLEGVLSLDWEPDERRHALLNEAGVNCIVAARGRGIRVMGARTLSGHSAWGYVPVARLFIGLAHWLKTGMDDLIFDTHTTGLWREVERRIRGHCIELMNSGLLAGTDPATAFSVKCDAETNPPAVRDLGQLVAEVGLAPSVPAEFIVVRVVRDASGITVTGP